MGRTVRTAILLHGLMTTPRSHIDGSQKVLRKDGTEIMQWKKILRRGNQDTSWCLILSNPAISIKLN